MTVQTPYTQARASPAGLLGEVTHNREVAIIHRRGEEDVALVSADELSSLIGTAHLLRSPRNAERLLTVLRRALKSESEPLLTLDQLHHEVGLDQKTA